MPKGGEGMEKKLIALVFIAVLGGLGGGYGLNYVVYQPQIQDLQHKLDNLVQRMDSIAPDFLAGNATFHKVKYVNWNMDENTTNGDYTTDPFLLLGKFTKLRWWMTGTTFDSVVIFWFCFENGTKITHRASSGFGGSFDALVHLPSSASGYRLKITVEGNVHAYEVWVWDYY